MFGPPLVLVPQYFGCLVFDRRSCQYFPFDAEATALLHALARRPIDTVLGEIGAEDERAAALGFIDAHYPCGFFGPDGRLAAEVREVSIPEDHLVGPLIVHLSIVGACNLTCKHCFAGELPRNHHPLTVPEMDGLFADLDQLGSFRLSLTGGEPLLRKDLFDIIDAATSHGLQPSLTTNGLFITEEIARDFGQRDTLRLSVSLEGPDAATNDAIRGTGVFDAVLEKLRVLRRHARFVVSFTITRANAHLVRECADLAYRVGAQGAVFRPLYPVGTAEHYPELMPEFGQYTGALRELTSGDSAVDESGLAEVSPVEIDTSDTCGAGNNLCSISVQGDVNPCSFLGPRFNAGNIRETPFALIWRDSQAFRRMRGPHEDGAFRGGCRARAQTLAGSAFAADPWHEEYLQREANGGSPSLHPGSNLEVTRRPLPLLT